MNPSNNPNEPNPDKDKELQQRQPEKVIKPINNIEVEANNATIPNRPNQDLNSIYPMATNDIAAPGAGMTPQQQFAVHATQARAQDVDRLVCMRAKSVLVIGIILAISSLIEIILSTATPNGTVLAVISFLQLLAAAGLLLTKDQHTAKLILLVFLIFQILGEIGSLVNPPHLIINTIGLILLAYAYFRVKGMTYS